MLLIALAFMVLFYAGVSPDVEKHKGHNWKKNYVAQPGPKPDHDLHEQPPCTWVKMSVMPGTARVIPIRREGFALNGVFGTALFVFVEVMLFAGFISAFVIAQNSVTPGMWPPSGQPRLPFERTALNTAALLASGVALFLAHRAYRRRGPAAAARPLAISLALGAFFVLFQGWEWAALLRQGLTLTRACWAPIST